jgi:hypothetical protein
MQHPIRSAELHDDVERWTERLLEDTGSATIEVTLVFNVRQKRFISYRLGGASSRQLLAGTEQKENT